MPNVIEDLSEEECYLWALISDKSGLDLAEFCWQEHENEWSIWRAWPYQWKWFRDESGLQIEQSARSAGKSLSIKMRAFAFPFLHPGQEMVIAAPELNHLTPIISLIEHQFKNTRLGLEMLPKGRNQGITHRPFQCDFQNGARIIGRIPQRDGRGVKGIHPLWLELDEAQDFPDAGWVELIETLKRGNDDARWRAHGVTKGVRDYFYKFTQPESGWTVHHICLPAGTLIYGINGPFAIEKATIGERVWSTNREGQLLEGTITKTIDNGVQPTWKVKAKGGLQLETTWNHPYLILSRAGTRRTRRELRFEWVEAQDIKLGDYIIGVDTLPDTGNTVPSGDIITEMLKDHSPVRRVPQWVWEANRSVQLAFLAGYLMGDGTLAHQKYGQDPWGIATASIGMAKELRSLCHYLGLRPTGIESYDATNGSIVGIGRMHRFYAYPERSWFHQIPRTYSSVRDGEYLEGLDKHLVARRVFASSSTGRSEATYDICVDDEHNYIAEGVVVHNTAMARPTWSDEERQQKIEQYGSRDHPDYRRNILGAHGDASNPLFVLHRLMLCVDQGKDSPEDSEYNTEIYQRYDINAEYLEDRGGAIETLLTFPSIHLEKYKTFWAGMDVGFTNHPSEILVFAEEPQKGKENLFCLVSRINLQRIGIEEQVDAILHVMRFYRVKAFSLDKTGVGLPLFQLIQATDISLAEKVKGYGFSEKILVDLDETKEVDEYRGDVIKDSGMYRNVLEYASDELRRLVDANRLRLPWDRDLIGEFQGQTYVVVRDTLNQYGKRSYSKGNFHALDAAKMAVLGWRQETIEAFAKEEKFEPTPVIIFGEW